MVPVTTGIQLQKFDNILKVLIWYSIIIYIVEVIGGSENSLKGHPFFLWSERIVAATLTVEYGIRLYRYKWHYAKSALGIIDLIAIVPFWIGFFIPIQYLRTVRTLRVLRLLKYFRYSRGLQLVALGFYRAWPPLRSLGFAMIIVTMFSTLLMFECEHTAQPDKFDGFFSSLWFTLVTMATIGYGDMAPITSFGRIVAMTTFAPALVIFAAIIGVIATSFSNVITDENCRCDPADLFRKEQERQAEMRRLDLEYRQ